MSTGTTVLEREDNQKLRILMGLPQEDDDYNALVEGIFSNDENRNKKFKNRLTFKDNQITKSSSETEPTHGRIDHSLGTLYMAEAIKSILLRKEIPGYTNEYITLKRKENILKLLTHIEKIESSLGDIPSFSMNFKLFINEIFNIYKNFLKTNQDENFLSILNLLEEIFRNNQINKKLTKAAKSILISIKDLDNINYSHYENSVKRFFELDLDFINIKEISSKK